MLTLYRQALYLRRREFPPDVLMAWLPAEPGVLFFARGPITCVVNLSPTPVPLPSGELILTSVPLLGNHLPADATAWLRPS
jgi:alpha-glucosidase